MSLSVTISPVAATCFFSLFLTVSSVKQQPPCSVGKFQTVNWCEEFVRWVSAQSCPFFFFFFSVMNSSFSELITQEAWEAALDAEFFQLAPTVWLWAGLIASPVKPLWWAAELHSKPTRTQTTHEIGEFAALCARRQLGYPSNFARRTVRRVCCCWRGDKKQPSQQSASFVSSWRRWFVCWNKLKWKTSFGLLM